MKGFFPTKFYFVLLLLLYFPTEPALQLNALCSTRPSVNVIQQHFTCVVSCSVILYV